MVDAVMKVNCRDSLIFEYLSIFETNSGNIFLYWNKQGEKGSFNAKQKFPPNV